MDIEVLKVRRKMSPKRPRIFPLGNIIFMFLLTPKKKSSIESKSFNLVEM